MGNEETLFIVGLRRNFKHITIYVSEEPEIKLEAGMYIMDYAAMVSDAEARNSIFMRILQHQIKLNMNNR